MSTRSESASQTEIKQTLLLIEYCNSRIWTFGLQSLSWGQLLTVLRWMV